MRPEEIISDADVERVHGNANFGSRSKRDVLKWGVLQTAAGFQTGSTARQIMQEHGLIGTRRDRYKVPALTKKGRQYLWAEFGKDSV